MKITQSLQILPSIREILEGINPNVSSYWDKKISQGIIPTEEMNKGYVDPYRHDQEMKRLMEFEVACVGSLFQGVWGKGNEVIKKLHYFGIGTGLALERIVPIAKNFGTQVSRTTLAPSLARMEYALLLETLKMRCIVQTSKQSALRASYPGGSLLSF